jgi:hypothetical protein
MNERNPWRPRSEPEVELKLEDERCAGCGKPVEWTAVHRVNGQIRCADCAGKAPAIGSRPLGAPIAIDPPRPSPHASPNVRAAHAPRGAQVSPAARALFDDSVSVSQFVMATLGGALCTLLGAAIWGGIAIATDRENRYLVTLLGLLAGYGVNLGAGRETVSRSLQLLAAVLAALGMVAANYIYFSYSLVQIARARGVSLGYVSHRLVDAFPGAYADAFGWIDAAWLAVAIGAAFYATRTRS